ncbi:cytochrome c biogenesis protein CcsA [Aureibacter tunicatorum]|uniref:cytochrome c biogenesis protein CcsA n=1 Tax=Aureibacter tunicatorum TaxID=866807 RepID=UPI00286CF2EA|nr:cytochrome c biogenesis protein CcsA [Aureibacter tunicatorum]
MKKNWWKILTIALLIYTLVGGMLLEVPRLFILHETIRALYYHVPMWFGMIILLLVSVVYAIRYLNNPQKKFDDYSNQFAQIGVLFGVLGILTGMVWANFTWGEPWSNDPKQNAAAIGMLIYFAYFVLRGSLEDPEQKAKIGAVYNIFAFSILIPLLFVLPRLTDSLHPGNGGNPGFNAYDLDSKLRMVFYPSVIAWTLLGVWMASLKARISIMNEKVEDLTIE